MKQYLLLICTYFILNNNCSGQDLAATAKKFINSIDSSQQLKALYPFDNDERYNFHFFPKENRKGISINELNETQKRAALNLLKTGLSQQGINKTNAIRHLEIVLRSLEKRKQDDHFRDSGKYFITIFGLPSANTIWGWRFEGHHISFTFSVEGNKLVSGTPGFLGANPAVVLDGPQKGTAVLKDEDDMGFALLHSFSPAQLKLALADTIAPDEIITFVSRKAIITHPDGILYSGMNTKQQQLFLQLVRLYIDRYTKLFADEMLKEIQQAGLNNMKFAWAGSKAPGLGHPHYYRIQGPSIIIEYDDSQNKANHVHTVIRDLKNDFGGDILANHYKESH